LKKNLGPKITKDPTRKKTCQLHPKTFSSSKMKQTSREFLLEKCLVKLFLKWSRQMTKFIKQTRASDKAKTRRKTRVRFIKFGTRIGYQ
jgi:hypothetical protein